MASEQELFDRGRAALLNRLTEQEQEVIREIKMIRDHYETGHGGKHPVPKNNSPLESVYEIMSHTLLDLEFLRNMDPPRHARAELLNNIVLSLIFQVLPPDMKWVDFEKQMVEGVTKFYTRQRKNMDEARNRSMIVRSGQLIDDLDRRFGNRPS